MPKRLPKRLLPPTLRSLLLLAVSLYGFLVLPSAEARPYNGPDNQYLFVNEYLAPGSPLKPIIENEQAAVILNKFPLDEGHALVIPKRPVRRLRELSQAERHAMMDLVVTYQQLWLQRPDHQDQAYDFSVYVNDGPIAGQSVAHAHIHVLPISERNPLPGGTLREGYYRKARYPRMTPRRYAHYQKTYPDELYGWFSANKVWLRQFVEAQGHDSLESNFTLEGAD